MPLLLGILALLSGLFIAWVVGRSRLGGLPAFKGVLWIPSALGVAAVVAAFCHPCGVASIAAVVLGLLSAILAPPLILICSLGKSFGDGGGRWCGRALAIEGRSVVTPAVPGDAWRADRVPDVEHLAAPVRRALASEWLEDARLEHASIAAFGRLSLQLMAVGAPPDLVARTHRAAVAEVEHARLCFALASAYGGAPMTAGLLPRAALDHGPAARPSLVRLAVESVMEGAVGEGTAAAIADEALAQAQDAVVIGVLGTVARDERIHAELGWDVFDHCLSIASPAEARAMADEIQEALSTTPAGLLTGPDAHLPAHGRLGAARRRQIHTAVIGAVRGRVERRLASVPGRSAGG